MSAAELWLAIREKAPSAAHSDIFLSPSRSLNFKYVLVNDKVASLIQTDEALSEDQIEMTAFLADYLGASNTVSIRFISDDEKDYFKLNKVWLKMSNQYTSRVSMFLMKNRMHGRGYFTGQIVDYRKHIWQSQVLRVDGAQRDFGLVTPSTRLCFLSASANMFVLIQLSREYLEYWKDRYIPFLSELFKQWKVADTSHVVSVIAFARAETGEDKFKVIIDWELDADWRNRLDSIVEGVSAFAESLPLLASSEVSCTLEAINMVLNIHDRYHNDRDLTRTGLSIVLLSCGDGIIKADKEFVRFTTRKVIDLGVWVQMILCGDRPSHTCPLIRNDTDKNPFWIDCDYYGPDQDVKMVEESYELDTCGLCSTRWDLYPPLHYDPLDRSDFSWESLTTPPCLPLCSDNELPDDTSGYTIEDYQVFPDSNSSYLNISGQATEYDVIKHIANELTLLRLNQSYQISSVGLNSYLLSFGNDFQRISFSKQKSYIDVKIFQFKKEEESLPMELPYSYTLHSIHGQVVVRSIKFSQLKDYEWRKIDDFVVSGKPLDSYDFLGFWRARFVLVPGLQIPTKLSFFDGMLPDPETLDDADIRVAAFTKFVSGMIGAHSLKQLGIAINTTLLSSYVSEELNARRNLSDQVSELSIHDDEDGCKDVEPLTKESEISKVVKLMRNSHVGLSIKKLRWFVRTYNDSFIGSDAVDWILKFYDGVVTREDARLIGQDLIQRGVWEHVNQEHDFIDGYFYYRFTEAYGKERAIISPRGPTSAVLDLSKCTLISLDEEDIGSNRKEWVLLHYDVVHNPKVAFHFQIQWLSCSSRLLDNLIATWANRAKPLGFSLIEVPTTPPVTTGPSPFEMAVEIDLTLQPPRVPFLAANHWDTLLVEEFLIDHGFVLDLEPDMRFSSKKQLRRSIERPPLHNLQYVCRSGQTIVHILGDEAAGFKFLWSRNKLALVAPAKEMPMLDLEGFRAICSNKSFLSDYWNKLVHRLTVNPNSINSVL